MSHSTCPQRPPSTGVQVFQDVKLITKNPLRLNEDTFTFSKAGSARLFAVADGHGPKVKRFLTLSFLAPS